MRASGLAGRGDAGDVGSLVGGGGATVGTSEVGGVAVAAAVGCGMSVAVGSWVGGEVMVETAGILILEVFLL